MVNVRTFSAQYKTFISPTLHTFLLVFYALCFCFLHIFVIWCVLRIFKRQVRTVRVKKSCISTFWVQPFFPSLLETLWKPACTLFSYFHKANELFELTDIFTSSWWQLSMPVVKRVMSFFLHADIYNSTTKIITISSLLLWNADRFKATNWTLKQS